MLLQVKDEKNVRYIEFDDEKSLNAIDYDTIEAFEALLLKTREDDRIRVVVLSGRGRAFSAGDNLKGMETENEQTPSNTFERARKGYIRMVRAIRQLNKPVIARVQGYALGAAMDVMLACDFIVAEENAKVGFVFTKRGLLSGTILAPLLVPYHTIVQWLFLGNTFSIKELDKLNLLYAVTTEDLLDSEIERLIHRLKENSFYSMSLMKRALNDSIGKGLEERIQIQNNMLGLMFSSDDAEEGIQAFLEKRAPFFTDV